MAWGRRKSGPKIAKNQPPPVSIFLLSPSAFCSSLSTSPQLPSPARIPTNPAYTPPRTPAPPQEASTTTKQPPRLSLSSPSGLFLSSANFFFLRSSNSGGQALHQRRHQPLHQHDHRPSPPQVVLHPCLASTARPCCSLLLSLHAEFILHAATKIISFGPGQFWPNPNGWAGSGPAPIFKKKIQKISKIIFLKNVIFSNIFLSILHNIGLYIYILKYNSGIKIPGFLRNISKKNK